MIIKEPIHGKLVPFGDGLALRLHEGEEADRVFLAYALVTQGPELQILPSVLLDDWGTEIGGLRLYQWIEDNGLQFPRAEVFGKDVHGNPKQYFLRDLELFGKHPTYVFEGEDAPDDAGKSLESVLVTSANVTEPTPIEPPASVSPTLRRAKVKWWLVGPATGDK